MINDAKAKFQARKEQNMQYEIERLKLEKERYAQQKAIYEASNEARRERDEMKHEFVEAKQEYRQNKFSFLEKIKAEGGKFDGSKIMNFDTGKIQSNGPNVTSRMDKAFGELGTLSKDKPSLFDTDKQRTDIFGKPPASYPDKPQPTGPAKLEVYK